MAKISFPFLILSFFISSFSLSAQQVKSIEGCNCTILLPGNFTKYIDTFNTQIGDLVYTTHTMVDTALSYQISYVDYPEGTVHSDSTELLLDFFTSTIEGSIESVKGVKKYESELHQFGYPGWFWKIEFGKNQFMKTKAFVAGHRFYTLQVFGAKIYDDEKKNFSFFDSFKFDDLKKIK